MIMVLVKKSPGDFPAVTLLSSCIGRLVGQPELPLQNDLTQRKKCQLAVPASLRAGTEKEILEAAIGPKDN